MNTTKTEWPKILVEYADPKRKREIISLEDAIKRFNLDERSAGWLERGETAGTSVREPHVSMIHRYTLEDSIRDAAPDLLKAVKLAQDIIHDYLTHSEQAANAAELNKIRAAVKKATGRKEG